MVKSIHTLLSLSQKPGEKNEDKMKTETPKTYEWLSDFKDQLLARTLFKKMFDEAQNPFYSIFDLADWDSKYKIGWNSMGFYPDFLVISTVDDPKLGKKMVLPEHVIEFIPASSKKEAHYICAVLNSSIVKKSLRTLSDGGKSGLSRTILSRIRLDKFDPKNPLHDALASLSIEAHSIAEKNDLPELKKVEKSINETVEQLYKTPKKKINNLAT